MGELQNPDGIPILSKTMLEQLLPILQALASGQLQIPGVNLDEWPVHVQVLIRAVEMLIREPMLLENAQTYAQLASYFNEPRNETFIECLHDENLPCDGQKHNAYIKRGVKPPRILELIDGLPETVINCADEDRIIYVVQGLISLHKAIFGS